MGRERELDEWGDRRLIGHFGAQQVYTVRTEELHIDQRHIVEKPFVVVDLIELSELRSELADRRLKIGEPRGKLPELVKEEEGLLDARSEERRVGKECK